MKTKPCICSKTNSRSSLGLSVSWLAQNATQCSGTQLLQNLGPLGVFVHLEFWGFSIFHSHTFIQTSVSLFSPLLRRYGQKHEWLEVIKPQPCEYVCSWVCMCVWAKCLSLAWISWGCNGIVNTPSFCVALSDGPARLGLCARLLS